MNFILLLFFFAATQLNLCISSENSESSEETDEAIDDDSEGFTAHWIDVPLDHFNLFDNRTWKMRYFVNDEFYQEGKPVFIEIGGEWTVNASVLTHGQLYLLAQKHHGLLVATEHRYYGKSLPFEFSFSNFPVEIFKYLQIEQTLEDLAYAIQHLKSSFLGLKDSKVIVHGCSYGGMLATWLRLRFPNTVDIAYASSAPVGVGLGYPEYFETVNDVYANVSVSCIDTIRDGFNHTERLLKINDGREIVETALKGWTCGKIKVMTSTKILSTMITVLNVQNDPVQFEKVGCVALSMDSDELSAFQRLTNFIVLKSKYKKKCGPWKLGTQEGQRQLIAWHYQMCTELGLFQTLDRKNSRHPFAMEQTIEQSVEGCKLFFGNNMTADFIRTGVERVNRRYGGRYPKVTKLVSVEGMSDPWKARGKLDKSNPEAPVFILTGSHCVDCGRADDKVDSDELKQAREDIRNLISRWISEVSKDVD